MKKDIVYTLLILTAAITFSSCDEDKTIMYHDADTTNYSINTRRIGGDYNAKIPGLNAQVIDYTLPNEYQHKSQLFSDSTLVMSWDAAGFKNANAFIKYFKQVQLLIRANNKEELAKHISFPMKTIATKKEFLENYDKIFDDAFKYEVLYQDPNFMFRNSFGALAGHDGQIWFKPKGNSYTIVAMNF